MIDLSSRIDALSDDERMVRDAAAAYSSRDPEYRRVRDLRGQSPSYDRAAWRELAEMGWTGCRLPESVGGMQLGFAQLALLLEQHGRALASEPLTAAALLAGGALLAGDNEPLKQEWLPRLAAGDWTPTLAWQEAAGSQSVQPSATRATQREGRAVLDGRKCFVPIGETADAFIVSAAAADGCALYLVDRDAPGLAISTQTRVDGGTWSELTLKAVPARAVVASAKVAAAALERVLDEGRLAASAELLGVMGRALEITVDYIKVREQFGKPIGSFQALQHRAVDMFVLVELSRAVLRQSAQRFDAAEDPGERALAASQAKARCSDAALKVAKGCVQLQGGIGYTDECNIGLFLKRAMVLAAWLGDASTHRRRYGERAGDPSEEVESSDPLRREVRSFLTANFPPEWRFPATRMGIKDTLSWQRKLAEKGWAAPGWPTEHGGMGLSAYDQLAMAEEFDRHGVSIATNMGITMLGPLLIRYGSEDQKRNYLPRILAGDLRWCQGYSEPGAGSDLAGLRTKAVLDGDEFVVNGHKIWTSFAHEADMIFMLVRTDPQAKKQEGISFLLADMKSPGITVRRIRNLTGSSEFCEVFFDNVRVPKQNLVGGLNRGWTMAKSLLGSERIMIGNPRLAKYPLQLLHRLMKSRGLLEQPAMRARYDELRLDVEDLGASFVRMAEVLRRGDELGAEVSMLKIWITEAMQRVTDLLLEVGAEGATLDVPTVLADGTQMHTANQYFASRPATVYGGSSEIQRNILAKAMLELPG
ncbi:acyl-CoA dehydrogenase [Aquabacterium sp. J223]|uniref:acyl-CoA dehydrogenase n=1 Tax=Aquabacterium sp. J223 TaxID=2898431 RepID=UPI0021ADAA01|nr:acyl-CoA dehydrogenase [Aquabacterium sp. J223]UUX97348.1 acyl-CoA dehydrogenase [Aquabacterium sp. J223]